MCLYLNFHVLYVFTPAHLLSELAALGKGLCRLGSCASLEHLMNHGTYINGI
jgi:hypothetical protein